MNLNILALLLILLVGLLMVVLMVVYRKNPLQNLREMRAFRMLRRAMGFSVENGTRLHLSLGRASLLSPQNTSALVGFRVLDRVAQMSSMSDRPPVVTSGEGALTILSQDSLRSAYREANALDQFDPNRGMLTGVTAFSYAAGAMPVIHDESVSGNIFIGNFGPEVALLTDAAEQSNAYLMAASDNLNAQAVLYAAVDDPIIGEELYASGAYLQAGTMHSASLRVQDILRWGIIVVMMGGAILKLAGVL